MTNDKRRPLVSENPPCENWRPKRVENAYCICDSQGVQQSHGVYLGKDNKYELIRHLSSGGSSLIYLALDREENKIVIIKELFSYELAERGEISRDSDSFDIIPVNNENDAEITEDIAKFMDQQRDSDVSDEIRFCSSDNETWQNDPNFFSVNGLPYESKHENAINLYWVIDTHAGRTLDNASFSTQDRLLDIIGTTINICKAVEYFHEKKGRIHCDLTPGNVYISDVKIEDPNIPSDALCSHAVMLIDLGSSHPLNSSGIWDSDNDAKPYFSKSGKFSPPEFDEGMYKNHPGKIGTRSDVYSIVKILYYLLLKDVPAEEKGCEPILRDLYSIPYIHEQPKPIQEFLINIIKDGTSSRKRFNTCEELSSRLTELYNAILNIGITPLMLRVNAAQLASQVGNYIKQEYIPDIKEKTTNR